MPGGNNFSARFSRGLIRWRESNGMTAAQVCEKYGIDQSDLRTAESAVSEHLTGTYIDTICRAIGVKDFDILILGENE